MLPISSCCLKVDRAAWKREIVTKYRDFSPHESRAEYGNFVEHNQMETILQSPKLKISTHLSAQDGNWITFLGGSCQCNVVATFFLWGEKCISRTLNMMCTTCNPGLQTLPQLSRDPAEEGMLLEVFTRFLTESDRLEREFNLPQQWLSDIYKPTGSKPGKWILDETKWHLVTNSKP